MGKLDTETVSLVSTYADYGQCMTQLADPAMLHTL